MNTPTVLVLPFPAQGHVNPMMCFSQKLVEHYGCKVIFVNTDFIHERVVSSMAEQHGSINNGSSSSLLKLVSIPDGLEPDDDRNDLGKLCTVSIRFMPHMLEKLIQEIHLSGEHRITCIVADVSMAWAMEIACMLRIKGAMLWPSAAALFALMYNIPTLIDEGIIDSDGCPTTKKTFQISTRMPVMDTRALFWAQIGDSTTEKEIFNYAMQYLPNLNLTEWWLCNTSHELEPGALSFVPKLLPIGPLLRSYDDNTSSSARSLGQLWEEDPSCMNWLDQQPHCSVVYVAFGSFALFNEKQFTELAHGLELTDRPFLWVVRHDSNCDNKVSYPNEFKGSKGKIVGWSPQQKVLSHPAIACFVSHCGWNSTMEGLSNGVPFLCWPYFGDQLFDETYICDELKVGLGFDSDDENGLVSRAEIKMKVDQLLSDENIRARSLKLKQKLMNSIVEGGRSLENINRFVKWLKD